MWYTSVNLALVSLFEYCSLINKLRPVCFRCSLQRLSDAPPQFQKNCRLKNFSNFRFNIKSGTEKALKCFLRWKSVRLSNALYTNKSFMYTNYTVECGMVSNSKFIFFSYLYGSNLPKFQQQIRNYNSVFSQFCFE